jgi:hypothetical protein
MRMKICSEWIRKFGITVLAVVAAFATFAATSRAQEQEKKPEEKKGPAVASIELTPNAAKAQVGDTLQFKAVAKDAAGNVMDVKVSTWFAAPFDASTVDVNGVAHFTSPGEITVGAVIGEQVGFAKVMVADDPIARLEIAPLKDVAVGSMIALSPSAYTGEGIPRPDAKVTWKSLTPAVAKVDASGMLTAVAAGTAKIEAASDKATAEASVRVVADTVRQLSIEAAATTARTGDVVHFQLNARDAGGKPVKELAARWSVSGLGGTAFPDGAFVAVRPGTFVMTAQIGSHSASASISIEPRNAERAIEYVAHVQPKGDDGAPIQAAEEWVINNHVYLSTIADRVFLYDVSDPSKPKQLDMLKVDARLVNDVSTTPNEKIGVISREGASNRKNGIAILDLSTPGKMQIASEYTETVTGGVHSAFIDSHYAYITDDATGSLRVIDFADIKHPKEVARFEVPNARATMVMGPEGPQSSGRYLHDLIVKDGIAYLAYWRDGLVILDVGNGMKGGSPEHPQVISQYKFNHYSLYGDNWLSGTHSVFRWKNYLFVGDEVLPGFFNIISKDRVPTRAITHVMDISDIEHPKEVAFYEVPEGGTHNFWVADDKLFLGDYGGGGRVIDISGELRGDLYRQGREIARFWTGDPNGYRVNMPLTWGAQPSNGYIYINDINSGLWIAKLGKPVYKGSTTAPPLQEKAQ